jgi:hypothetical protein
MSTLHSEDRVSLCTFTFADGRRCRTPRHSGHPHLCYFHARKEAQALAAEQAGRDIAACLSGGRYLSACNLSIALARLFSAVAQGHIKPKTANTLAYLGQTLLQTIRLAQHEYINAFDTNAWRSAVRLSLPRSSRGLPRSERGLPGESSDPPRRPRRVPQSSRDVPTPSQSPPTSPKGGAPPPRPPNPQPKPGSNPLPRSGSEFYDAVCKLAYTPPP